MRKASVFSNSICLHKQGTIPDRYTADPDVDLDPNDEDLSDIRFTDVSDGMNEDVLIAAIDFVHAPQRDADVEEAIEAAETAAPATDAVEEDEDDELPPVETNLARRILEKAHRGGDQAAKLGPQRYSPDVFDRLPTVIGSHRECYRLGVDVGEERDTSHRRNGHPQSWKTRKVSKQHLRHGDRDATGE